MCVYFGLIYQNTKSIPDFIVYGSKGIVSIHINFIVHLKPDKVMVLICIKYDSHNTDFTTISCHAVRVIFM